MAINVQHAPNFNMLGNLAMQTGWGQYRQRQDQQDFQNWLLADRARREDSAQQARLQLAAQEQAANQIARERGQMLDAARLNMSGQQQQFDNRLRVDQLQGQNQWRADQLQDNFDQRQHQANLQDRNNQWQWDVNSAKVLESNVDNVRTELHKKQLTPEGRKVQAELMGALRGIQRDRALQTRPEKYADALGQWLSNVERARLDDYEIKVPTVQEHFQQNVIPQTVQVQQPDGSIVEQPTGAYWVREFDTHGQPRFKLQEPPKATAGGNQQQGSPFAHGASSPSTKAPVFGVPHNPNAAPSFEEYIANPKTFNEEFSHFQKELTQEDVKTGRKMVPDDEAVLAAMRKRYELRMKAIRPQQAQAPAMQPQGLPVQQQPRGQATPQGSVTVPLGSPQEQGFINNGFMQVPEGVLDDETLEKLTNKVTFVRPDGQRVHYIDPGELKRLRGNPQQPLPAGPQVVPPNPNVQQGPPPEPAPAAQGGKGFFEGGGELTILPENRAVYEKVKTTYLGDSANEAAIAREVHRHDLQGLSRGDKTGGQVWLESFGKDLQRIKDLKAKYNNNGPEFLKNSTEAEKREMAILAERVRPYMKRRGQ